VNGAAIAGGDGVGQRDDLLAPFPELADDSLVLRVDHDPALVKTQHIAGEPVAFLFGNIDPFVLRQRFR
jgi:hypothetical protein